MERHPARRIGLNHGSALTHFRSAASGRFRPWFVGGLPDKVSLSRSGDLRNSLGGGELAGALGGTSAEHGRGMSWPRTPTLRPEMAMDRRCRTRRPGHRRRVGLVPDQGSRQARPVRCGGGAAIPAPGRRRASGADQRCQPVLRVRRPDQGHGQGRSARSHRGLPGKSPVKEGQDVKTGDLLYQIEKVQFQAQVEQAKGNLTIAQAELTMPSSI